LAREAATPTPPWRRRKRRVDGPRPALRPAAPARLRDPAIRPRRARWGIARRTRPARPEQTAGTAAAPTAPARSPPARRGRTPGRAGRWCGGWSGHLPRRTGGTGRCGPGRTPPRRPRPRPPAPPHGSRRPCTDLPAPRTLYVIRRAETAYAGGGIAGRASPIYCRGTERRTRVRRLRQRLLRIRIACARAVARGPRPVRRALRSVLLLGLGIAAAAAMATAGPPAEEIRHRFSLRPLLLAAQDAVARLPGVDEPEGDER